MEKYLQKYLNGTHKSEWIENAEKVLAQLHDYKTKYESNDVIIFEDGELKKNKIIDDAIDAYEQSEATAMMQMLNTNKSYKKAHHSKLFKQLNNYVHKSKDINKRARVEIVDFVQHMIKQINRKQHSFFVTPRPGDYQLISQLQTFATNIEKPTVDVKKAFNSMKNVSICKAEIYKRYINQLNTKIDLAFSDIEAQVAVPPVA